MCMLLGFEVQWLAHLPPNVALFALEDNQSSAKALEPTRQSFNKQPQGSRPRAGLRLSYTSHENRVRSLSL
jgi:hypothetical protein